MKIELDRPLREYSRKELIEIFGTKDDPKTTKADLFRALINNGRDFLETDDFDSLRYFWYHPIKPALGALGYLEKESDADDPTRRMTQSLTKYLAEGVRKGTFTYKDLKILDNSRSKSTPREEKDGALFGSVFYKTRTNQELYPEIILAVEKNTVYKTVKDLATFFGCSCISGSGQDAFSAMENLLDTGSKKFGNRDIHILTLTDYDPAGYNISDTFKEHAKAVIRNLKIKNKITIKRIGIEPDQLEADEIERERYPLPVSKKKKKQIDEWFKKTNGVNGELFGLELDALPKARVREIFIKELQAHIKQKDCYNEEAVKKALIARIIGAALEEIIQDKIDPIVDRIYQEEENSISATGINIFELAMEKKTKLSATDLVKTDRQFEIMEKAIEYYNED